MSSSGYVFDLKMLCGGFAYFSTYTMFHSFSEHLREIREPCPALQDRYQKDLSFLGHPVQFIKNDKDFNNWLYLKGWACVSIEFARKKMSQWIKKKKCIKSPLEVFTDVELVSKKSLNRSYKGDAKQSVLNRDGNKCLLCGEEDELTMQHVQPFSKGGETSSRNLVTLCNKCNQSLEAEVVYELYDLAGLHQGYDPSLIKPNSLDSEKILAKRNVAVKISSDLMNTRCEVW